MEAITGVAVTRKTEGGVEGGMAGQGEGRVEMYIAETLKGEEGGTGRKRAGT